MPEQLSSRALCTLEDVKAYSRELSSTFDDVLTRLVNAASQAILREAGREFVVAGTNPQTRTFPVGASYRPVGSLARAFVLWIGDLASAPTAVEVLDDTGASVATLDAAADLVLWPTPRPESWRPITGLRFRSSVSGYLHPAYEVSVTGAWGFPEVPDDIRQAAIEQTDAWFRSRHLSDTGLEDSPFARLPRRLTVGAYEAAHAYRDGLV